MNRICFRLAIARPDVGFDYFGSWNAYNPGPVLEEARRALAQDPSVGLRLQCSDERGKQTDLGWNSDWLHLLESRLQTGVSQEQWNRLAANALLAQKAAAQ